MKTGKILKPVSFPALNILAALFVVKNIQHHRAKKLPSASKSTRGIEELQDRASLAMRYLK